MAINIEKNGYADSCDSCHYEGKDIVRVKAQLDTQSRTICTDLCPVCINLMISTLSQHQLGKA